MAEQGTQGRLADGKFTAPVLRYNGKKDQENTTNQFYAIPQSLADIIFAKLGNKSAQLRVMLVLVGTKEGFFVSENWICDRTGLTRQSYERARDELKKMGWLSHKASDHISVNFDTIYKSK